MYSKFVPFTTKVYRYKTTLKTKTTVSVCCYGTKKIFMNIGNSKRGFKTGQDFFPDLKYFNLKRFVFFDKLRNLAIRNVGRSVLLFSGEYNTA